MHAPQIRDRMCTTTSIQSMYGQSMEEYIFRGMSWLSTILIYPVVYGPCSCHHLYAAQINDDHLYPLLWIQNAGTEQTILYIVITLGLYPALSCSRECFCSSVFLLVDKTGTWYQVIRCMIQYKPHMKTTSTYKDTLSLDSIVITILLLYSYSESIKSIGIWSKLSNSIQALW